MMTAVEKIRRFCEYQDRCEAEVRRKMAQLLVPAEERESLMAQLKEERYVDDGRFAESFIRGKVNQKRWGRVKIKVELQQRGISASIISKKMSEMDEAKYEDNLRYLVGKWKSENPDGERGKMARYLMGKGYTADEIFNIDK